jgi:hypothetical protein
MRQAAIEGRERDGGDKLYKNSHQEGPVYLRLTDFGSAMELKKKRERSIRRDFVQQNARAAGGQQHIKLCKQHDAYRRMRSVFKHVFDKYIDRERKERERLV